MLRNMRAALAAAMACAALALAAVSPTAEANTGKNVCLSAGSEIYSAESTAYPTGQYMHYAEVWHEYGVDGNWSEGYVVGRGGVARGYIPHSLVSYQTGDDATTCH
jgi:hypothetical protein